MIPPYNRCIRKWQGNLCRIRLDIYWMGIIVFRLLSLRCMPILLRRRSRCFLGFIRVFLPSLLHSKRRWVRFSFIACTIPRTPTCTLLRLLTRDGCSWPNFKLLLLFPGWRLGLLFLFFYYWWLYRLRLGLLRPCSRKCETVIFLIISCSKSVTTFVEEVSRLPRLNASDDD